MVEIIRLQDVSLRGWSSPGVFRQVDVSEAQFTEVPAALLFHANGDSTLGRVQNPRGRGGIHLAEKRESSIVLHTMILYFHPFGNVTKMPTFQLTHFSKEDCFTAIIKRIFYNE